ncbi:unnamed protein product [Mytilus edulis]|uniref:Uncharacterized protein n=1 Tax=Mytilus edulis TaxID=6550 RepID=A0A8S3TXS7_MYTED|nr:unnamed protein product [Mytilus edulis]
MTRMLYQDVTEHSVGHRSLTLSNLNVYWHIWVTSSPGWKYYSPELFSVFLTDELFNKICEWTQKNVTTKIKSDPLHNKGKWTDGISVIAVGDLYQLKPVMDSRIFCDTATEYGVLTSTKSDIIESIDSVCGDLDVNLHTSVLSKIPDDPSKTMGLYKHLKIAEGLHIDVTLNVNVDDGLTNGVNDAACNSLNRPYYGTVVFTRCSVSILDNLKLTIQGIEITIQKIEKNDINVNIIYIYCSPKIASLANFAVMMEKLSTTIKSQTIIMGDLNFDVQNNSLGKVIL